MSPPPPLAAANDDGAVAFAGGDRDAALWDGFWRVVALDGWSGTTFRRVSAESGLPLADLRARFATPREAVLAYGRRTDRLVLEGTVPAGPGDAVRDRLFDLLMRRFDALRPHRAGVLRLRDHLTRDPLLAASLWPSLLASMAWTLEGAEVDVSGLSGAARVHGLAAVWLDVSRAWADDESEDLGATMAALDRALDRAERVARTVGLTDGDASEASLAAAAAVGGGFEAEAMATTADTSGPEAGGYDDGATAAAAMDAAALDAVPPPGEGTDWPTPSPLPEANDDDAGGAKPPAG